MLDDVADVDDGWLFVGACIAHDCPPLSQRSPVTLRRM
jgi:hypothetical protein